MKRLLLILLIGLLAGCTDTPKGNLLEQVRHRGELVVITRLGPTTYYENGNGKAGLEYELSSRFAKYLGVKLKLLVAESFEDVLPMVIRGEAHIAAAGLTITPKRKEIVKFGPVYQKITPQLVYRLGNKRPRSLEDVIDGDLEVTAGSSHSERLEELRGHHPDLHWKEHRNVTNNELLNLVFEQVIDYTIADSNALSLFQRYNKEVNAAFDISKPQSLAWAMQYGDDDSLQFQAENFFRKLKASGELAQLIERYYGHADQLNFVGTRLYTRHIKTKLPRYQAQFEKAAEKYKLDWRLLAAIGYQESHWKPRAKSPTGVRGIMMLTQSTARQLKVKNRLDPAQSIEGGARYFRLLLNRIPERIANPDRTWLALAAYNVGFYHVEDARIITEQTGGDPDKWIDVKERLPLLRQKKWYKKTKYGYARGDEPVKYVENIRIYYDLLSWNMEKAQAHINTPKARYPDIDSSAF